MSESIQWWDNETVQLECHAFCERYGTLMGISEDDLQRRFGAPDRILEGMKEGSQFEADHDLHYHSLPLLGHSAVAFAIVEGIVQRIYFFPKVKECPPYQVRKWGKLFSAH